MGCHFLLQGIFLTQGSNLGLLCLLHCRLILYPLSRLEDPNRWVVKSYSVLNLCFHNESWCWFFLMPLCAVCIFSLVNYLFTSFRHCYWVSLSLSFVSFSCILNTSSLLDKKFKIFSLSLWLFFFFSFPVFQRPNIFNFSDLINHIFLLWNMYLMSCLSIQCLTWDVEDFVLQFCILHLCLWSIWNQFLHKMYNPY